MFGNWATGRAAIVTAPTITVRIAITIATMGRLIKNLDISVALHERPGAHLHAGFDVLGALGNDALTGLQSFADYPHGSHLVADFDLLNAHRVLVVQHGNLMAALQFRHSALGDEQCASVGPNGCANLAILPWPQPIAGVREESRQ